MKSIQLLFFLFAMLPAAAQSLTEAQQKAINNYVSLTNHLTNEIYSIGPSLTRTYLYLDEYRSNVRAVPSYTCRLEPKQYYFDDAQKTASSLGAAGATLQVKSQAVQAAFKKIDETCKGIEIYFRLKDYEADKFKKFEELTATLVAQVGAYAQAVQDQHVETEKLLTKLQPYQAANGNHKATKLMRDQLAFERELLVPWTFNLKEHLHTGWPSEKAQQHALADMKRIESLRLAKPALQYPASSQYGSFIESVESLQQTKRNGIDNYTFEEQQSDKHSNDLYFNLINYYNNAAVSFYNNYVNMANQNGYRGVYYFTFPPQLAIRSEVKTIVIEITPFTDKPAPTLKVTPVATAIPAASFEALAHYVDFINEGVRQLNNMMNSVRSVNGDASRGKASMAVGKQVYINYHYKQFEMPVTLYQTTIAKTKALPTAYQQPLIAQAEVLYSILNEVNQWNTSLLADAASKQLTKDSLNQVYAMVNRFDLLVDIFDQRKENLFKDVRRIYESFKQPIGSWTKSGNGLRALLDADYEQLLNAKKLLGEKDLTVQIDKEKIERQARDLITNEYSNLTGIQKLGRYHGGCPYSPYEDLSEYSITFPERIISESQKTSSYRHPYNEIIYLYNFTLVEKYNKFASLSKVSLLQSVKQLEWFEVMPPQKPEPKKVEEKPVIPTTPEIYYPEPEVQPEPEAEKPRTTAKGKKEKLKVSPVREAEPVRTGAVIHDTVRITDIIRIETVRQDTVYVSKVDTVYVGLTNEEMMSMEGYATNNMVLLLDVSGSMNAPEKLPLLKKSVLLLMKMMREEDQVSIITYSGKAKVELPPTSFKEEEKITKVIERLKSEGNTDGNAGIKLAYQTADKNYIRGGNNRIVLATDGEFPISKEVFELVKKFSGEDIFISVFNFGKTSVATKNLQQLATLGKGSYEYITRENVDMKLIKEAKAKKRK